MSDVNVILATNRLQIAHDGDDILLDSVTYINIVSVNPLVYVHKLLDGSVPGMPVPYTAATVTTEDTNWAVELHLADGRIEIIKLIDVQNQPDWSNDADGYAQAEADIYAAFPTSGGGGSGTVTSVAFNTGTSGFGVTGSPVTTSGTLTLTGYAAVRTGNTLWVDRTIGNDTTGTADRQDLPYLTVMGALADAGEGDLIHVRAGTSTEVITDASGPDTLYLFFEPGATAESITVSTKLAWSITGGRLDEDITFSEATGGTLTLQTITFRNLTSNNFNTITARECTITGNVFASNSGTIELRNSFVAANTTVDDAVLTSYNTQHTADATVTGTGVMQGYASEIGGVVTDNPVAGDYWDGVAGADGDTAIVSADGRWGWQPAASGGVTVLDVQFGWDGSNWIYFGENQLGTTVSLALVGDGQFRITADSGTPFTRDKTFGTFTALNQFERAFPAHWQSTSYVEFFVTDLAGTLIDTTSSIQAYIRIYP